jgi:hypothetical protein
MASGVNFGSQQYFGFDPKSIPGCYIWNDASTLSAANGTTVGTWSNSVSSVTITAGGTVSNSVLNNRTVVNFTTAQTWETSPTINLSAYSMFAVSRQTGGTNGRVLQSVTNNQLFGYWNGYKRSFWIDGNPNQLTTAVSDTNWDLMGHTRVAGGAYVFNWNGSNLFSGASSGGNNLTGLAINTGGYPTEDSTCQIAEIIVYSNVLTTSQVGQVEGYLAWKWGLSANLPVGHPYKRNPPAMRLFQPIDVADSSLWLDPVDTLSLTLSGSSVTQWRDKSGRGAVFNTVNANPTYNASLINGFPGIDMTNASGFSSSTTQTLASSLTLAMILVVKSGIGAWGSFFTHGQRDLDIALERNSISSGTTLHFQTNNDNSTCDLTFTTDEVALYLGTLTTGTSRFFERFGGGTTSTTTATNPSSITTGLQTIRIGRSDVAENCNSYIGEILYYNRACSSSERQQVEGYLAWKWGLRLSLPTTHPFYNFPPATPLFTPRLLDNCALWFDAADTSTITGSSPVTAWVNKGTISTTASTTTGSTTTSGNTFNGLNYISMPSGTEMNFTAAINTQARSWFVVARATTPFTSNPQFWGPVNATANGRDGLVVYTDLSIFLFYMGPNGISIPVSGSIANPYNRVGIYALVNSVTASLNILTDNGTPATLYESSPAANYNTGSAAVRLSTAGYARGTDYMELILYYGDLSPPDRQRVEGYLAWKWGLQANLPTTHPYYKFRP